MSIPVQHLLQSFDLLPEADKREVAAEIIRRSLNLGFLPLSDEELVSIADGLFLELDRQESTDE